MCITQCKKLNKIVILFILHQYKFHRLVAYVLGPVLNTLLGTKFHLRNAENFVEDGSIIVANHQSVLDFQGMITIVYCNVSVQLHGSGAYRPGYLLE